MNAINLQKLHQISQTDPTHYFHLMLTASIEQKIKNLIAEIKTTEKKCLIEYEKRSKIEGTLIRFYIESDKLKGIKNKKNTRGNIANIETFIGDAISNYQLAKKFLEEKKYDFLIHSIILATEKYGMARGILCNQASSHDSIQIRNNEICIEAQNIKKSSSRQLSDSEIAEKVIKNLGYKLTKKRNIRRIINDHNKSTE